MAIDPNTRTGVVKGLRIHAYADLRGADLQGADLMGANLDRKPELTGPIMDAVVSMIDALGEE